jgi:hypothetical protein
VSDYKKGGYNMDEGGFLVKFDGKEVIRCYEVAFDYDEREYMINGIDRKELPPGIKSITLEVQ